MKGKRKRMKAYFPKHHPYLKPGRASTEETANRQGVDTVAARTSTIAEDEPFARTRHQRRVQVTAGKKDEYIIVNRQGIENLFNTSAREHLQREALCEGALRLQKTEQKGLSSSWTLYCDKCNYTSLPQKMYQELNTGRPGKKPSTLNLALGTGLLNSPIGVTTFRELMLHIGIDPGSETGLQKIMNKSGEIVTRLAEENMADERQKLRQYESVAVACDARYNNPISSGNSPFQGGSQAVFTVTEDMSPEKKVIHVTTASKLCTRGTRLRSRGENVTCPGHDGCLATLGAHESIGMEGRYAQQSAEVLKEDKLHVSYVTSDGDSRIIKGFRSALGPQVQNMKDQRHFSLAQKRLTSQTNFSVAMFPGTKKTYERHRKWFAEDLRIRCTAELTSAIKSCNHISPPTSKKEHLCTLLASTPQAIIACYKGNCDLCMQHSFVCDALGGKSWRKTFVPRGLQEKMEMTPGDEGLLHELILRRLGPEAISVTYLNSDTQKVEAMNRAYSKTNPKTVTSVRNFKARVSAAVLTNNAGFDGASRLTRAATFHAVSEDINRKISQVERRRQSRKAHGKTFAAKKSRAVTRAAKYQLYEEKNQAAPSDSYKTGIDLYPGPSAISQ